MSDVFDLAFAVEIAPILLKAAVVTIEATLLGFALALAAGVPIALARMSSRRLIAWPVGILAEFIRGTPLLLQLYFAYFSGPAIGIDAGPLVLGAGVMGLHFACYTAEVYRAGIESVPRGQSEAAKALGFRLPGRFVLVIVPQALPPIVPALGNYLVLMFKETPLLSAITLTEMLLRAKIIGAETFRYVEPITLVGAIFLVLSIVSALGVDLLHGHLVRRTFPGR